MTPYNMIKTKYEDALAGFPWVKDQWVEPEYYSQSEKCWIIEVYGRPLTQAQQTWLDQNPLIISYT